MNTRNLALMFVLFIFAASCSKKAPVSQYKYEYETVDNDPTGTLIYTLENGLKVYMSVNKQEPRVQTLIAVRAGSKFDPAETTGLAHYLEHMLFKGTDKIGTKDWDSEKPLLDMIAETYELHKNTPDPAEKARLYRRIDSLSYEASKFAIANEYDKMISSLGAKGTNAYTSNDETVYINDIPSNELEKWLMVEGERFRKLVLRLFHTELETVYEEFNRSQDSDGRWTYQAVLEGLFPNHPYGTQTTIGLGEHLKNPSMYNIHEYFDNYYRPNNVAICLAGDLDPDATVDLIKKYFGEWEQGEIPEFKQPETTSLSEPIEREIFGPQQEMLYMGFKFDGAGTEQHTMIQLVDMLLTNSQAGLIDLNLNLNQKVLRAGSFVNDMNDYSVHFMYGMPKQNQTLEEVKDLILEQIEKIKKGDFDEWLVEAAVNNLKLQRIKSIESNSGRAFLMVQAFINELPYENVIFQYDRMADITKQDIINFANKHYSNNYVVAYKRMGVSDRHSVPKPEITSIELDRDTKSEFFLEFEQLTSEPVEPRFLDFEKDIAFSNVNNIPFAYVKNENNQLFSLYYIFDMGSDNSKELALAVKYLPYLGTSKYSSEDLNKEFFRLALDFDVYSSRDKLYVTLSGLESSMEEGIELFEHILSDVQANESVYVELVSDILKERADAKLNKNIILRSGLGNFAKYGPLNPHTDILSEAELTAMDVNKLANQLRDLTNFKHRIFYFGQQDMNKAAEIVAKHHKPAQQKDYPEAVKYIDRDFDAMEVLYVPYDMQQVEMIFVSKGEQFNADILAPANMFNEYFGSGLSSIVFQEIREQKALAYSAYAFYSTPAKADEYHYVNAYVGTQSDKLQMAADAMIAIMNEMPEAEMQFNSARESIVKKMQTDWITGEKIYWQYERALNQGLREDIRKQIYEQVQTMSLADLKNFFDSRIKGNQYTIGVIGNEKAIDKKVLQSLGKFRQLSLEETFGY
jgi:zinc protease